tara:strand:+ start:777 stop:1103 length:327 start_codon:yes stop_codon:yes gene_type:complete
MFRPIGKSGINTSFVINKNLLKKIINGGGCQEDIDKEIENKHKWLQLNKVIQSIPGKTISTILAKIKTREVIVKVQESEKAKKEYDIQDKIKTYKGVIKFECLFFCEG